MPRDFATDSIAIDLGSLWGCLCNRRGIGLAVGRFQGGGSATDTVGQRDGAHEGFGLSLGFAYQLRRDRRWRTTSSRVIAGIEFPMSRNSSFCCRDLSEIVDVTNDSIVSMVVSGME